MLKLITMTMMWYILFWLVVYWIRILVVFVNTVMMEIAEDAGNVINTEPVSEEQEVIDREELERELAAVMNPLFLIPI